MSEERAHSKNYKKCKKYFGWVWTKSMLRNMVESGKLYDWEYEELTGESYENEEEDLPE